LSLPGPLLSLPEPLLSLPEPLLSPPEWSSVALGPELPP
jgi:hypothetical protein